MKKRDSITSSVENMARQRELMAHYQALQGKPLSSRAKRRLEAKKRKRG